MSSENIIRTLRIAATADIHYGHSSEKDGEFGTSAQWGAWFRGAQEAGAQILVLAGDNTDEGIPQQALEIGQVARRNFQGLILAINGNHDLKEKNVLEVTRLLRKVGIHVIDDTTMDVMVNGIKMGFIGSNGSIELDEFNRLKAIPRSERIKILHKMTEERYVPIFEKNLKSLVSEGVDCIIPVVHIPVHPAQYSDTVYRDFNEQLSPSIYNNLVIIKNHVAAVIGGHVHSVTNPAYRRDDPLCTTQEGIPLMNVAAPNAIRQGKNPIFLFDVMLEKSEEGKNITLTRRNIN